MSSSQNCCHALRTASACVFAKLALCSIGFAADAKTYEADLALVATLKSAKTIQPGEVIHIDLQLHNRSQSKALRVVKTGDGSGDGRRVPHVDYAVQFKSKKEWIDVPRQKQIGCALYDYEWWKGVTEVAPGGKLEVNSWISPPSDDHDFQKAGRYRIVAHYRYDAVSTYAAKKQKLPAEADGIPDFKLTAAPLEIEVVRPLDVKLTVKSPGKANMSPITSELFAVELVNQSKAPVAVTSATVSADARLYFEVKEAKGGIRLQQFGKSASTYGIKKSLAPGEKVPLLGQGDFANGIDGPWELGEAREVQVRAVYWLSSWKPASIIKSDWVTWTIEP
jgi:hypothetical protein